MISLIRRLRPQIMIAILSLFVICIMAMWLNGGASTEIATAGVTGIILLAREVIAHEGSGGDDNP